MKFRTHNDGPIDTHLTQSQGYIQASRKELELAFGKPQEFESDRVTTLWDIEFEDGRVATVYDWKRDTPELDEPASWHVGGKTWLVVGHVHDALRHAIGVGIRKAA